MKTCGKCKIEKPLNDFHKNKNHKFGVNNYCKICKKENAQKRYAKNPEYYNKKTKEYYEANKDKQKCKTFQNKYGITLKEKEKMLENQNNRCLICSMHEKDCQDGVLCVDHCHDSGKVRGLLCHKCNTGLGKFNDNINIMKKAIKYLNKMT